MAAATTPQMPPHLKITPDKYMQFKDLNFKLIVINILMYERALLKPKFNRKKFAKLHGIKDCFEIDMLEVPAVRAYFENLDIPASALEKIEIIDQDGGDLIYQELAPQDSWGGEDDRYWIRSCKDLALLPNIRKVTVFEPRNSKKLAKEFDVFEAKGIETFWG